MKPTLLVHFLIIFLSISIVVSGTSAEELKTASTIKAVTVYNDQALITRAAIVKMPAGIHTVIFTGLPFSMIDNSLKISGVSDYEAKISDIKIEKLFLDTIPEAQLSERYRQLENLRSEKNVLERTNLLYKSQADAVEALQENYSRSLANPGPKPSLEEWDKFLQYIEKRKAEYWGKMESVQADIQSKVGKIKLLEDEIKNIGGLTRKAEKEVVVTLHAEKGSPLNLEITYLIPDASWQPAYETRVTSAEKSLQLVYSGNVHQSSGEDWQNIDLTLSTAQPAMSENVPSLARWVLDTRPFANARPLRPRRSAPHPPPPPMPTLMGNTLSGQVLDAETDESLVGANVVIEGTTLGGSTDQDGGFVIYNIPEGTYRVKASYIGYQAQEQVGVRISRTNGASQSFYLPALAIHGQEVVVTAQRQSALQAVNQQLASNQIVDVVSDASMATSQPTSSSFSIQSKQSLPSDNQDHKVGIAIENFPIDFSYEVVPKVVQGAFLKGRGKNILDYPLLAGDANIFLDNSFVGSVPLKTMMPGDSFSVNLGVDDAIRVERRLVSRYKESVGTFSTKTRVRYEFENVIENHKKYAIDVSLTDQVPVSSDEKIVVELLEPKPEVLTPDADGMLKWKVKLEPGAKKVLKLKFTVEYPPSVFPYGLE